MNTDKNDEILFLKIQIRGYPWLSVVIRGYPWLKS